MSYAISVPSPVRLPAYERARMLKMLGLGLIMAFLASLMLADPAYSGECAGTALTIAETGHPAA